MNNSQCLHCKIKESDNKFCSLKEKYEILIYQYLSFILPFYKKSFCKIFLHVIPNPTLDVDVFKKRNLLRSTKN